MGNSVVGIYSDEVVYANRLMDYLNQRNDVRMEVRIFTNEASLLAYRGTHGIGVLLVDEKFRRENLGFDGIGTIIWLVNEALTMEEGEEAIHKFQKMEDVVKSLLRILLNGRGGLAVSHGGSEGREVIGVYTPYGDAEGVASALVEEFSRTYSTLWINMECHPRMEGKGAGLTELLYFIHEGKGDFSLCLASLVERRGRVGILAPIHHFKDLLDVGQKDVRELVACLRKNADYERIILQMEFFGEYTFEALDGCDRVIVPVWKNQTGRGKMETCKKYMAMEGLDGLERRLHVVEVPIREEEGWAVRIVKGMGEERGNECKEGVETIHSGVHPGEVGRRRRGR